MPKTVLILGAGASCEYGLPCGPGLRDWILDNGQSVLPHLCAPQNPYVFGHDDDLAHEFVRAPINLFLSKFRNASTNTVDEFLQYQPDFRDIGRLAITACLLDKEAQAAQSPPYHCGCYPSLANALLPPRQGIWPSDLDVITFNYDRTFELILSQIYAGRYGIDHAESARRAIGERVVHVYGDFTMPYTFDRESGCFVPANRWSGGRSESIPPLEFAESAKGIAVIGEDRTTIQDRARSTVTAADRVVFLGFGFDRTNLEILGIERGAESLKPGCAIHTTAYRLGHRIRDRVCSDFPSIKVAGAELGCAAFMEELGGL